MVEPVFWRLEAGRKKAPLTAYLRYPPIPASIKNIHLILVQKPENSLTGKIKARPVPNGYNSYILYDIETIE